MPEEPTIIDEVWEQMPCTTYRGEPIFYRTVEALLEQDPVKEHRYQFDAMYHAQVYRTARDIVAIAHASANLKEKDGSM